MKSLAILVGISLLSCALSQEVTLDIDTLGLHTPRKTLTPLRKCIFAPTQPSRECPVGGVTDSTILGKDRHSGQVNQLIFETDPGLLSGMVVSRSLGFDFDSRQLKY